MMKSIWPVYVAAAVMLVPGAQCAENGPRAGAPRVYGPSPAPARRVYGPQPAPGTGNAPSGVTVKVASSTQSTKPVRRAEESVDRTNAAKTARLEPKQRPVTIYFVHGEEKQSIVEFALPMADGAASGQRAMSFEASKIEADVDGKLLLRGDVRIRFGNGMRLGAQLVSVTVGRDEGPVEIVVKE